MASERGKIVVEKRHALVNQSLNFRNPFAILERLQQIFDAHLEVQSLLGGHDGVAVKAVRRFFNLFLQDLLIKQHYDDVIEVVTGAGVVKDPYNVPEIAELVFSEKLVVQIERPEDHIDLRCVVVIARKEWVVQDRQVGAGGI